MSKYQKSYRRIVEGLKIIGTALYVNLIYSSRSVLSLGENRTPEYLSRQIRGGCRVGVGKVLHSPYLINYGRRTIQVNKRKGEEEISQEIEQKHKGLVREVEERMKFKKKGLIERSAQY